MLSDEQQKAVQEELAKALKMAPLVERRIVRAQSQNEVQQGRRRLLAMAADVRDAFRVAVAGQPVEPPPIDPPIDPPGNGNGGDNMSGIEWPEPGDNGNEVIENYEVTRGGKVKFTAKRDYFRPKFYMLDGMIDLDPGSLGDHVRLFEPVFERIDDRHVLYPNMNHPEVERYFECYGAKFVKCSAPSCIEVKGSCFSWVDTEEIGCKFNQFYRGRHNRKQVVIGYNGEAEIAMRGWLHYVDACPKARGIAWAGNLEARYDQWKKDHIKDGGFNMQRTELSYYGRMRSIEIGHLGQPDYPALDCFVHPDMREMTKLSRQTGTEFKAFKTPQDFWKHVGFLDTAN